MSCNSMSSYIIGCNKDSLGGLRGVKAASFSDISSITETDGIITAITMKPGKMFYEFKLVRSTSSFANVPTANAQNGTAFYAESATLVFNKLKAATSKLVDSLAKSSIVAVVEDQNGEFILLGRTLGLDVSGGTIGSGTAGGDRSGYELQFTGEEPVISHVDPAIVPGLLIPSISTGIFSIQFTNQFS